eukprot:gene11270-biopygen3405
MELPQPAVAAEARAVLHAKLLLRASNQHVDRLDGNALKGLESSLKRVNQFLKKVKERLCNEMGSQLLMECCKLNLSKYVDEIAIGVADARLKSADLPAATQLCSLMHRSYASFASTLQPQLIKNASLAPPPTKPGASLLETEAERNARLYRKRSAVRLLLELLTVGVFDDAAPVLRCIYGIMADDSAAS